MLKIPLVIFAVAELLIASCLAQAKIGERKAEFEAQHGKPVKISTLGQVWPDTPPHVLAVVKDWELYDSDFYPPDVAAEDPILKRVGVWYGLGKINGVWYPAAQKDETVMRALETSIGTSDLIENKYPKWGLMGVPAYVTEDGKYYAYVIEGWGTFIGTEGFINTVLAPAFIKMYETAPKPEKAE